MEKPPQTPILNNNLNSFWIMSPSLSASSSSTTRAFSALATGPTLHHAMESSPASSLLMRSNPHHNETGTSSTGENLSDNHRNSIATRTTTTMESSTTSFSTPLSSQRKLYSSFHNNNNMNNNNNNNASGTDTDLVKMLHQVSELTMEDEKDDPFFQFTPTTNMTTTKQQQQQPQSQGLAMHNPGSLYHPHQVHPLATSHTTTNHSNNSHVCQTPEPMNFTPEVQKATLFLPAASALDVQSPPLTRLGSSKSTPHDARVFTAPPLPSSPELSIGGGRLVNHNSNNGTNGSNNNGTTTRRAVHQTIAPQFSPIAGLRMGRATTAAFPVFDTASASLDTDHVMESTESRASNQVVTTTTTDSSAPPMPWMDTPEQPGGRKRVVSFNQLKMRKRNLSGISSTLSFVG